MEGIERLEKADTRRVVLRTVNLDFDQYNKKGAFSI